MMKPMNPQVTKLLSVFPLKRKLSDTRSHSSHQNQSQTNTLILRESKFAVTQNAGLKEEASRNCLQIIGKLYDQNSDFEGLFKCKFYKRLLGKKKLLE